MLKTVKTDTGQARISNKDNHYQGIKIKQEQRAKKFEINLRLKGFG